VFVGTLTAVGCGGGGGSTASTSQGASSGQSTGGGQGGGGGGGEQAGTTTPRHPEGEYQGGEKSIEEYGSEAGADDRGAILASFEGYLDAVAEEDSATACSYLSARVRESLEQLVARGRKGVGCAQILPKLLAPTAAAISREQANGKVTRVRVEGDQAFVVFHAPGAKLYTLGLVYEGGQWKATTVAASVLVPQL